MKGTNTMALAEELEWRGLVHQTTLETIDAINEPRTFYLGVDPSASSMHIGNLAQLMVVKHLVRHGHKVVVLVGGATGMIGDPKEDAERELKTLDEISRNKEGIAAQYKTILNDQAFEVVDNYDWFRSIGYLEFLRDVGKHFSMTQLLDREFIKARIGEGSVGISYAEFSYSLIQGYDFLHLYREKGVTLQIGGSDQWGNMVSGAQMIKKLEGAEAHVWTVPLIVDSATGKKFGKSEGNAIWLDPSLTSPYKFYQFWLNVSDETAENLIKIYTFLTKDEVEAAIAAHRKDPSKRTIQKMLASEVTELVHGLSRRESVEKVTDVLFGAASINHLSKSDLDELSCEIPTASSGSIQQVLVDSKLVGSNGEARRLVESGAVKVNGMKVDSLHNVDAPSLVKKGKNGFILVR